ncbi:MAG: hypothetical protein ACFFG0_04330 [Candidatus Thorarchaeota archaeon]
MEPIGEESHQVRRPDEQEELIQSHQLIDSRGKSHSISDLSEVSGLQTIGLENLLRTLLKILKESSEVIGKGVGMGQMGK